MGVCLSRVDDAVNDFLDRQSRYYDESKRAKEYLEKKKAQDAAGYTSNVNKSQCHEHAVLQSELSPIYPFLPNSSRKCHCRNVYDGDTLTLEDGNRVRLLGIDTPELREKQPFAVEAKEYTKRYCHGRDIWLTFDENARDKGDDGRKDHYGRLLAFVWVSLSHDNEATSVARGVFTRNKKQKQSTSSGPHWLCINEGLVASGLAHVYFPGKGKKLHNHDKFLALQKLARVHKRGHWRDYHDFNVVVTPNGTAFHKCCKSDSSIGKQRTLNGIPASDCKHLARSKNLSLLPASDAYDRGLHPCRNCLS